MSHAWIDLDTYNIPDLRDLEPERTAELLLDRIDNDGGVRPTSIISSGRGIYGIWAFDSIVPAAAATTIEAINKTLVRKYAEFGADQRSVDSTRVLRIPGSINSRVIPKFGSTECGRVGIIYDSGLSYRFGDLANEILPFSRVELAELRQKREARRAAASKNISQAVRRFDRSSWSCGVIADMQRLADSRWGGVVPKGQRDIWIFIASVHIAWMCRPGEITDEIAAIAIGWGIDQSWIETGHYLHSVVDRATRSAFGERTEWSGKSIDPKYRFRKDTLIDWLKIEPDEMIEMSCLIDQNEKNRRSRSRRDVEASHRDDRRYEAVCSFLQGESIDEITKKFGIDPKTLYRWRQKFPGIN
ncbi:MAG TPA: helix-turn-helix domain-containing protein [Acidiphilium sp.]|nr:helix-turn-helix domain-containing protein [Acidiphilium sp.]